MNTTYELSLVCCANKTISFRYWRPLESPVSIINWITDALSDLFHGVKLVAAGFYHEAFLVRAFLRAPNWGSNLCLPI